MLMVRRREDCRCGICHTSQFPSGSRLKLLLEKGGALAECTRRQHPQERGTGRVPQGPMHRRWRSKRFACGASWQSGSIDNPQAEETSRDL